VRWIWGILLAAILIGLMPVLQALLELGGIVEAGEGDLWFHGFAIEVIVLLCVLVFRRTGSRPRMRVIKPRGQPQDED